MKRRLTNGKACPDWRPWFQEIKDDCCLHYGVHTGKCWKSGVPDKPCPWEGKLEAAPEKGPH